MLGDVSKNRDEEMVTCFLLSSGPKEWRIWKKRDNKEPPLETEIYSALIQRLFPMIPEIEVGRLDLVERNDASLPTRPKLRISTASLPALELRFQDPHYSHITYIAFIEGRENINNFLRSFIKKYSKEYPIEGVIERAIDSIEKEK